MDRFDAARTLDEIGTLLSLKGENPYKVRAYESAARSIVSFQGDFEALVREGRVETLPGIGKATARIITELMEEGRSKLLEELRAEFPRGVVELAVVPEVGVKRAIAIHRALGITSRGQLETACRAGLVQGVKGIGPKTEARILDGLERYRERASMLLLPDAHEEADAAIALLKGVTRRVEIAGQLRRGFETVDAIDLVAEGLPDKAFDLLRRWPSVTGVEDESADRITLRLGSGARLRVDVVDAETFPRRVLERTGPAEHVKWLDSMKPRSDRKATTSDAADAGFYARVGIAFVPPELRDDPSARDEAEDPLAFDDLIRREDLRGLVHVHTTFSDGRHSVLEMARAAEAAGMEYLTITDHSPAAHYAGGLDEDRLKQQWEEIDAAQEQVRVRLLKGTESDILEEGGLDYPDRILERFDVIVASIHVRHGLDARKMTQRVVRALQLPVFKIWGHALGRLLGRRPPIDVDVERILDAAAKSRVAIEVNGDPNRLDLPPDWIRAARRRGIPFVLSVDAHATREVDHLRWAVRMARRGGLRRSEVLNTLPVVEFARRVRPA